MNRENAHLFLPLVQALADGKQLEYRDGFGVWGVTGGIDQIIFEEDPSCYRIKPEPRTYKIYVNKETHQITDQNYSGSKWERITVQEVIK